MRGPGVMRGPRYLVSRVGASHRGEVVSQRVFQMGFDDIVSKRKRLKFKLRPNAPNMSGPRQ
jgi:hypothetical protein